MKIRKEYDVIVVGGGPAGSATSTFLAKQGRSVLLVEREPFPRFRIGESFMPATWWTFEKLGILPKLHASDFTRKHGVQFWLGDGRPTRPFYFSDVDPNDSAITWQVDRGAFDSLMLEHARECGVEVLQPAVVSEMILDGGQARGVRLSKDGGTPREIASKVVVDSTGQAALMASSKLKRTYDPVLRNTAIFTRFEKAYRDPGRDAGSTLVMHTQEDRSWFWYIPLAGDVVSVGVVGPVAWLATNRSGSLQETFDEEVARCPSLVPRIQGRKQVGGIKALRDFSYISDRISGDGWVLAGDAFGFLDPIYSSGVLLALTGADMASESIAAAFRTGDFSAATLGQHGHRFVKGMEAMRHLVYAFYMPDFHFKKFLERYPECRPDLTDVLVGNVYRKPTDSLYEKMDQVMSLPPGYKPLSLGTPVRSLS